MTEVDCDHCSQSLPLVQAFPCVCGNVVFCSQECFEKNSHSRIEDDEHEFANSLQNATVDVKLARLIGKGKYIDLVNSMTKLIVEKQNWRKNRSEPKTFEPEIKNLVDKFVLQTRGSKDTLRDALTAYLKACELKCTAEQLNRISERMVTLWSSDAPLAKKNIATQMASYNLHVAAYFVSGSPEDREQLENQGFKLGNALNGKRK